MTKYLKSEDRLFEVLECAAVKGIRCPTQDELRHEYGIPTSCPPSKLAKEGRIRIEVWAHNWRVVEIMQGPHKGKRTKASPLGTKPYQIVYKDGILLGRKPKRDASKIIADANKPVGRDDWQQAREQSKY